MIDVDAGVDERAHRLDMTTLRGGDERGAAIAVCAFHIRAVLERQFQDVEMAARAGIEADRLRHLIYASWRGSLRVTAPDERRLGEVAIRKR